MKIPKPILKSLYVFESPSKRVNRLMDEVLEESREMVKSPKRKLFIDSWGGDINFYKDKDHPYCSIYDKLKLICVGIPVPTCKFRETAENLLAMNDEDIIRQGLFMMNQLEANEKTA